MIDQLYFDSKNIERSHLCFDKTNKKVIGKSKDEASAIAISEFVGSRSMMYSHMKDNNKEGKTAKGIKKYVIKKNTHHENYKAVPFNNKQMYHQMKTIRSNNHQLGSYELNKVSLSCFDVTERFTSDSVNSYAYGHHKTQS